MAIHIGCNQFKHRSMTSQTYHRPDQACTHNKPFCSIACAVAAYQKGMNCILQGSKSCCHLGCERAFAHTRFKPAFNRSAVGVAVRLNRSNSAKTRHIGCRVANTSEASTSVSSSPPTYGPTQKGLPQSEVWELDFCSRPLLDERGKKRWELLICSPDREFEYSVYFPNNKINSTQVCCV